MLTTEQLQARKGGIGGSEIAAVLGVSPYATPLDVYRDKLDLVERPDLAGNEAVHFGNVLEDVVAEEFSRRTRLKVRRSNILLEHKDYPILRANIDRGIVGQVLGVKAGLECKTADKWAAKPELWGKGATFSWDEAGELEIVEPDDQVPEWYLLQCAHYMAVTGAELWFLAVLIGGNDFRIYTIPRDAELEQLVIDGAVSFWRDHVLAEVPPAPICGRDLEALYPRDDGSSVSADEEALQAWAELKEATAQLKALEARIEGAKIGGTTVGGLKNKLRAAIGEHAELLLDAEGKPLATWKNQKASKRFDEAAFKAAHPKLYREFQVERPGPRVLLIK